MSDAEILPRGFCSPPPSETRLSLSGAGRMEVIDRHLSLKMNVKPIPFNPRYSISDDGRVFGVHGKELSFCRFNDPYHLVRLVNPCKRRGESGYQTNRGVHRLVAEAFIGPKPFPGAIVRHKNDNPIDNRSCNLCWGTHKQNAEDRARNGHYQDQHGAFNGNSRLSHEDVLEIIELRKFGLLQREIGKIYGITQVHVSQILLKKMWAHIKQDK